jgi:sugar phosphate isomerase/epimerase
MRDRLRRLSLNTATTGHQWPLARVVQACAHFGLGGIAPWRRDLATLPPPAARRAMRDAGLACTSLCRGSFLTHDAADKAARRAILDDNRRAVEEAHELGTQVLCMVVGGPAPGSRSLAYARAQVQEMLAELVEHARPAGVRLAVEPLHPMYAGDRSCINTLASALDVADAVGGREVGVVVDAYHVWWDPELERQLRRAGPDRLLSYQVCDWLVPTRDLLNDRGMMGDGVIDLKALGRSVEEAGYGGPVEVEIFSAERWWRTDPAVTIRTCAERFLACC